MERRLQRVASDMARAAPRLPTPSPEIVELQTLLNKANGNNALTPTGLMDDDTVRAVKIFQATHTDLTGKPLDVDGQAGPNTMASLHAAVDGAPPGTPKLPEYGGTIGHRIARIGLEEYRRRVIEEAKGKKLNTNTGVRVKEYQSATGLAGTGWAWCAAFVTWCYEQAGLLLQNEAGFAAVAALEDWARAKSKDGKEVRCGKNRADWTCKVQWATRSAKKPYRAPPGAIVIFDYSHTGIVVQGKDAADDTVEGNTSAGGSGSQRDGGGVYLRTRTHGTVTGYVVLSAILDKGPPAAK